MPAPAPAPLVATLLLALAALACCREYTHEEVIQAVQTVFPPQDGSSLQGQGLEGVLHLQAHVLSTLNGVGCPQFPAGPGHNGTWTYPDDMLAACLWAKLGKMANEGVQSPSSGFAYFALDTLEGRVVRGRQDTETQRSLHVLTALVVILLLGLGAQVLKSGTAEKEA